MASAVYKRIFDDVFVMTSAQKPIRSSVFGLYFRAGPEGPELEG